MRRLDVLRSVDPQACAARQLTLRWQEQGHEAWISVPPAQETYLAFCTQGSRGSWHGLVGTQDWLTAVMPQLRVLLSAKVTEVDVLSLFQVHAKPLNAPVAELDYHSVSGIELVEGSLLQGMPLPCLLTPEGPLWLLGALQPKSAAHRSLPAWVTCIPLDLNLTLGNSLLRPGQVLRLACGDILPIAERTHHLTLAERHVGSFTLNEEGFRMEFTTSPAPADQSGEGDQPLALDALNHLPVRLEYVLQQSTCSLAELAAYSAGQVLPLLPSAQHNVEVRANGKTIALGELVQWEGCLGVELHKVYQDATQ